MAEVGMKSRPAGPGRDEFSRSDPRSDPSSDTSSSPFLYPPSEVRISRFGQILTSLERFRVFIAKFSQLFYWFSLWKGCFWRDPAGGFRLDFLYTENSARPRSHFIYTKNSGGRPCRKWLFDKRKIGLRWRIFGFWSGDDARENGDFQSEKQRLEGTTFLNGGDIDETRHLVERKLLAHYHMLFCDIFSQMEIIS